MAKLPYLAAAGSAIIFGFSFLFTKNALANLAVLQLLGLRFLLAAVFLALLRLLQIIKVEITAAKIKGLLLVAIFQPVLYFCFETVGVNLTAASLAGVIISLIPMVVALLAVIFLKEELSFLQWLSVLASVGGVVLVTLPSLKSGSGQLAGILALLGAVLCGALFNIYSKRASAVSSPVEVTYFMMWVGAVVFNGAGLLDFAKKGIPAAYFTPFGDWQLLFPVLYLGLFSSVAAFFLMNYSLARLAASKSAVFINLTPVVSVFAGVLFRGESFTAVQVLGSAVILAGVWGVSTLTGDKRVQNKKTGLS